MPTAQFGEHPRQIERRTTTNTKMAIMDGVINEDILQAVMDALYLRHHDEILVVDEQEDFVIGTRATVSRTNWLHRHDAFSQIQSAYMRHLQESLSLHCNSIANMI